MILSLDYGRLSGAVKNGKRLADELDGYCEDLSRKVQKKMYSVQGGTSSALDTADYYVRAKMRALSQRADSARDVSQRTQRLLDTAKRVDKTVESDIQARQESFFKKNPELRPSAVKLKLTSFLCGMKDVPILGGIIKGVESAGRALDELKSSIKFWWRCGDGRDIFDMVIKIGAAVAAVITAVTAVAALVAASVLTLGGVLFAVAACVAAVIAVVNAITNIGTSIQAMQAREEGRHGLAKVYSGRDSLASVLRETNFHNRAWNRGTNTAANVLEITEAVAGIVVLVHSIGEIAGKFLSGNGVGFAFKEIAKGRDGKLTTKVTLRSIWKGTKAMVLNKALTESTKLGLRTTLINNLKEGLRYKWTLLKYAAKDPKNWWSKKQVGDRGLFRNSVEKIRYDWALFKKAGSMTQAETAVKNINSTVSNVKLVLDGISNLDGKGLARRISEKIVSSAPVFDNSFVEVLDSAGITGFIFEDGRWETLKDYSGVSGEGIRKHVQDIVKNVRAIQSIRNIPVIQTDFKLRYPYFECEPAAGVSGSVRPR